MKIHARTHTGDKPFVCKDCGKSFNEKGNLKIHIRIHTGEKPYKCNFENCGKEFKAYGHLSDHLKRHMNIKPHICETCNTSFSRKNTLKTHIMTHTGEKPHACSFSDCNRKFAEKGNMKTHLKTHQTQNSTKKGKFLVFEEKLDIVLGKIQFEEKLNNMECTQNSQNQTVATSKFNFSEEKLDQFSLTVKSENTYSKKTINYDSPLHSLLFSENYDNLTSEIKSYDQPSEGIYTFKNEEIYSDNFNSIFFQHNNTFNDQFYFDH